MLSLVKNSTLLDIHYFAQSSSIYNNQLPNNVFDDIEYPYFHSDGAFPKQWWQIVFFETVSISSYFIKTNKRNGYRPKKWAVDISFNNKTWKTVDTREGIETANNTNNFNLKHPVYCKFFRLVFLETSNEGSNYVCFTHFDCFGTRANNIFGNDCSCIRKLRNIPYTFVYICHFCILSR